MKKIFALVFIALTSVKGFSQFDIVSMPAIPDSIRKGADVIKRHEEIRFEVTDIDRAKHTVHQVYTVLNSDGDHALIFHEVATKYAVLDEVEIKMYDASGRLINKYKKKDIYKQSDMSGLVEDGVHYMHELKAPS